MALDPQTLKTEIGKERRSAQGEPLPNPRSMSSQTTHGTCLAVSLPREGNERHQCTTPGSSAALVPQQRVGSWNPIMHLHTPSLDLAHGAALCFLAPHRSVIHVSPPDRFEKALPWIALGCVQRMMAQLALLCSVEAELIFSPSLGDSANLARLGRSLIDPAMPLALYLESLPCWWLGLYLRCPESRYLYLPSFL